MLAANMICGSSTQHYIDWYYGRMAHIHARKRQVTSFHMGRLVILYDNNDAERFKADPLDDSRNLCRVRVVTFISHPFIYQQKL